MFGKLVRLFTVTAVFTLTFGFAPAASAENNRCEKRANNTVRKLLHCVTVEGVREHLAAFQAIADANGGTRADGTPGYEQSAEYVRDRMREAGYKVTVQEFLYDVWFELSQSILEQTAPASVSYEYFVDFVPVFFSGSGDVTAPVQAVDVLLPPGPEPDTSTSGCEVEDFSGFISGNIALLQRGGCTDSVKTQNAQEAGASAVIIFNEGQPDRTELYFTILGFFTADFEVNIPVIGTTFALGETLANTPGAVVHVFTETLTQRRESMNVFAETRSGNPSKIVMAGAHLDSVPAGPGINDNGSGSAALLEVAEQMAKVKPRNKVRFAWWGAEEEGLLGSAYYVFNLSQTKLNRIALYLNFDMVASPNYVFFLYDGDDSDGVGEGPGPKGSAHIERTFGRFYKRVGEPTKGTDFDGRSDYLPFIIFDIPAGGIFTGAEGIKTPEEAAIWGGTAGEPYDPCYHEACDTFANINDHALDRNADAIAFTVLKYAKRIPFHHRNENEDLGMIQAPRLDPRWRYRSLTEEWMSGNEKPTLRLLSVGFSSG